MHLHWSRAIMLLDMDAFFAAIEQADKPELKGQPLAITNSEQGSCIITCSYEARQYGVKTGMRLAVARHLCPQLKTRVSRPQEYMRISTAIMQALHDITPDIEVFSVDEAFLDITYCQKLHGDPIAIAKKAQEIVKQVSGLTCSIGVGGDKTLAKYAAGLHKPAGITCIHPDDSEATLASVPVGKLCGIGPEMETFLARHGVYCCADMKHIPVSVLAKRFGNLGRRIWLMCQGKDPSDVDTSNRAIKSMGHSKVLPPCTWQRQVVTEMFHTLCEKLARRLRASVLGARRFHFGMRTYTRSSPHQQLSALTQTDDGQIIFKLCQDFLYRSWQEGMQVNHISVRATDPKPNNQQPDLFDQPCPKRQRINRSKDAINCKFGNHSLKTGSHIDSNTVIAPSWRPDRNQS